MWASCRVVIDQTHIYNHGKRTRYEYEGQTPVTRVCVWSKPTEVDNRHLPGNANTKARTGRGSTGAVEVVLPNRPHREALRGWHGPYLARFQRIAPIDKQT